LKTKDADLALTNPSLTAESRYLSLAVPAASRKRLTFKSRFLIQTFLANYKSMD
jgi:hypothetical protein